MQGDSLRERIEYYREALNDASGRFGGVEICAVSKTVPADTVNLAYDAGIRVLGENRVQEIGQKFPALNPGFSVHLIGHLQTNKVKYILDTVSMVQSLDRMDLAGELDRRCRAAGRVMPVLIQVNIARESQKSGVYEEDLNGFLLAASRLSGIAIKGLMAIMPMAGDPEEVRPYFRRMREWYDRLKGDAPEGVDMDILSMGMSGDCFVAAQEGATMVRIGTAIFGGRH